MRAILGAARDAEKQKLFVEYYQLLKVGLQENEVIYFADSTHPQHQTRLAYGWSLYNTPLNAAWMSNLVEARNKPRNAEAVKRH